MLFELRVLFIIIIVCVLQTPIPDAGFGCTEPGHLLPHRDPATPGLDVSTPHRPLQQIQLCVSCTNKKKHHYSFRCIYCMILLTA